MWSSVCLCSVSHGRKKFRVGGHVPGVPPPWLRHCPKYSIFFKSDNEVRLCFSFTLHSKKNRVFEEYFCHTTVIVIWLARVSVLENLLSSRHHILDRKGGSRVLKKGSASIVTAQKYYPNTRYIFSWNAKRNGVGGAPLCISRACLA